MRAVLSFIIFFFASQYLSAQSSAIDVQQYRFQLELNDANDTIYGQATIALKLLQPRDDFYLDLTQPGNTGKGMQVTQVSNTKGQNLSYKQAGDKVWITLPANIKAGDTTSVIISYKGMPADGLIISKNKYGHRTFFSDNWPNRAHHWIPCNDDPADKATAEFIVTAPDHYKVISNGLLQEEKKLPGNKKLTHWKETVQLPTKVMVIGAADFAVQPLAPVGDIPLTAWAFPETGNDAAGDYGYATEILKFFSGYIGPYGYKKLANVQSKTIFGGMENASAIFYFENSVDGKKDHEDLVAHEIAHQWFGNMATEKTFSHLWLSEGFATYFTNIYLETKYGKEKLKERMIADRQTVIAFTKNNNTPVVDSVSPLMDLLNANSYQKGGWVLHMLRRETGDSAFHAAIKKYYAAFAGRNATTQDLQKVFETVTRKDLGVFFKQWLYTPGIPVLSKEWKYLPRTKQVQLTITQKQAVPFKFPLELMLTYTNGKTAMKKLQVNQQKQTFTIPANTNVKNITPDPEVNLLFEEQ